MCKQQRVAKDIWSCFALQVAKERWSLFCWAHCARILHGQVIKTIFLHPEGWVLIEARWELQTWTKSLAAHSTLWRIARSSLNLRWEELETSSKVREFINKHCMSYKDDSPVTQAKGVIILRMEDLFVYNHSIWSSKTVFCSSLNPLVILRVEGPFVTKSTTRWSRSFGDMAVHVLFTSMHLKNVSATVKASFLTIAPLKWLALYLCWLGSQHPWLMSLMYSWVAWDVPSAACRQPHYLQAISPLQIIAEYNLYFYIHALRTPPFLHSCLVSSQSF